MPDSGVAPSSPPDSVALSARWDHTWQALGLRPDAGLRDALLARLSEPGRHYHTVRHVAECLREFDAVRHLAARPAEVELALWFHDAVYDPRIAANEERSADWARRALEAAKAAPDLTERVAALILATKHHTAPRDPDARLVADIDLAILGAPPRRFAEYESEVQQEFAWAPEEAFRRGRAAILRTLLAREAIFHTEHFRERLEAQARANLAASLDRLRG